MSFLPVTVPPGPPYAETAPAPLSARFLLFFGEKDPAPGPGRPKSWSGNLDCERLTAEQGSRALPGVIEPPPNVSGYIDRTTVVCRENLLRPGLRSPADEALLRELAPLTAALAENAASVRPDLATATWHVEAYVPNPQVGAKVSFATKNALMQSGLSVSDRTPFLGFGDLDVITRMAPEEAYPTACARYFDTGSLGPGDALLAVLTLDPRETVLHAGVCADGRWQWLR